MEVRIEEVRGLERLRAVRAPWHALWTRDADATPFSSPAWLLAWCEHLGREPPWAIAAWRGDELVALAPTFLYRDRRGRVLATLGGGVSDYQDVLGVDGDAVAAVVDHLSARGDQFDLADLQSVPSRSKLLPAVARCGLSVRVGPEALGAVLQLPARFEDLSTRASANLLRDVRYQRRRLAREGGLEVLRVRDSRSLGPSLDQLFQLHGARWRSRGEPGVLATEAVQCFHRAAAAGLLEMGALRLIALHRRERPIATLYGLAAHGRAYVYLFGTDPSEAHRSPGALAIAQAVEDAIGEGATELDFLRGDEAYKDRWGAVRRHTVRLHFRPLDGAQAHGRSRGDERDVATRAWPPRSS